MQLVTIVLTTLNSERFIARSIASCLAQTYAYFELLIVDGGSNDRTLEIVASYDDPRIRVLHQRDNAGKLPGALNLGMANSRGELITWTQDDSWYEPHAIAVMSRFLAEHVGVGLVYTDFWVVDEAEQLVKYERVSAPEEIAEGGDIIGACFLFRREVYDTIGPQDERYFPVHEVPWRIRLAQSFTIHPLQEALMYYTLHPGSLTGRIGPWPLRYRVAETLLQTGCWDRHKYRQKLAQIHVDHAYDSFILHGHFLEFWKHLLAMARLSPKMLTNRGTWKLILASVLPVRESIRQDLLIRWKADEAKQLQQQCEKAHA
jgi:hypothetical protein